jgi:hypothetical protein
MRMIVVQANARVDEAPYAIDLEAWRRECGPAVPTSQAGAALAGKHFVLDALVVDHDKRLAKEWIRSLGGQVCAPCASV